MSKILTVFCWEYFHIETFWKPNKSWTASGFLFRNPMFIRAIDSTRRLLEFHFYELLQLTASQNKSRSLLNEQISRGWIPRVGALLSHWSLEETKRTLKLSFTADHAALSGVLKNTNCPLALCRLLKGPIKLIKTSLCSLHFQFPCSSSKV